MVNRDEKLSEALRFPIIRPGNELFPKAVHYYSYQLIKKSARYDDDLASDLNKVAKTIAEKIKNRAFNNRNLASIITFLQDFKLACNACNNRESAVMSLLNHYSDALVESLSIARAVLPTETIRVHKGSMVSCYAISSYSSKRYATDDTIAIIDTDFRTFKQKHLTATSYAQHL